MALPIKLLNIHFGERDALHEFMKQDKDDLSILDNSFVVPPRVRIAELESGSRYFVLGPKGSGKTTLLWHLMRKEKNSSHRIILFKSEIRKEDRDRLDKMVGWVIVEDQKKIKTESDYKSVWEWYLLKNIFSLIKREDIISGQNVFHDIQKILNIKTNRINTIFDNFHINSVKGKINFGFGHGDFKSEIGAEIEARQKDANANLDFLDVLRIVKQFTQEIIFRNTTRVRLYFDELEFFMSSDDDGERDRRLIRDLIFSIYYINTLFSKCDANICILASLRTEILNSLHANNQEVEKIIDAFGVKINWYNRSETKQKIITIFENKIKYSEVMLEARHSYHPWATYFPEAVEGKEIKSYLLDLGLHRPRGVLLRLAAALEVIEDDDCKFEESHFLDSEESFGRFMLQEFTEEMSAFFDNKEREWILSLFRGHDFAFDYEELQKRVLYSKRKHNQISAEYIIKSLYRIGMIGNQFTINSDSGYENYRTYWSYRGNIDPIIEERFVLHLSVRKALQAV